MTSLNSEESENDAGAINKENTVKTQWKKFATHLGPVTAQEEYACPTITPQTTKALRAKTTNFISERAAHYQKSLTARSTEKTFFPEAGPPELPKCEPSKCSVKQNGIVKSYAANTNQGLVRTYNEDRVSIILNIVKPASRTGENWPKCSFFGVYDGHGGSICADFLRDNLHQYVIKEPSFPSNPREALRKGFESAEKHFLDTISSKSTSAVAERSGSCAIVVLIVGDMCFVANVGDSRAVLSGESGHRVYPLSCDHKPSEVSEQRRIIEGGGKVYQSQVTQTRTLNGTTVTENVLGPHRVLPGRLSVSTIQVSRTFGDTEAKLARFGGNPNVIIAIPDIKAFRIAPDHDFILMASDGIFDKLSNRDVIQSAWAAVKASGTMDVHQVTGAAVEAVLKLALTRRSLDNVTVVMVGLPGFRVPNPVFPSLMSSSLYRMIDDYYTSFTFKQLISTANRTIGLATFTQRRPHYPEMAIVKVLPSGRYSNDEVSKLLRYRKFTTIVKIYAYYRTDQHVVIFLEYCEKESMDKYMETLMKENKILPEDMLLEMMKNIAEALGQLHNHYTVHRDIKPHNVFVTKDNCCKLGDLETLKAISKIEFNQYQSRFVGTVEYMSPEKRARYDENPKGHPTRNLQAYKEDVWAMGKTFYDMCVGTIEINAYFKQPNSPELRSLVFSHLRNRNYSARLSDLIYRMLSLNMDMSCEAVIRELHRIGVEKKIEEVEQRASQSSISIAPAPVLQRHCDSQGPGQPCEEPYYTLLKCSHSFCGKCLERFLVNCQYSPNVRFLDELGCPFDLQPLPIDFLRSLSFLPVSLQGHISMLEQLSHDKLCDCGEHSYVVVRRNGPVEPYLYECPTTHKKFCSWCGKQNGHVSLLRRPKKCKAFPYYEVMERREKAKINR